MSKGHRLPDVLERARSSRLWLRILNATLSRMIPFNRPHLCGMKAQTSKEESAMKRLIILAVVLLSAVTAQAVEVAGTSLAPSVEVAGETLTLNGYGIRKKFFFKIYIGSLYTPRPVPSVEEALAAGNRLIRMTFLYSKVERQKILDAFSEGFSRNSPELAQSADVRQFLSLFDSDFYEGDVVDLELAADGTVAVRHNQNTLGSLKSPELARAILLIYLGEHPADEDLRSGMLGRG